MRIGRTRRHGDVTAAHGSHVAGSEAGDASAGRDAQLRWAGPGGDGTVLRLHGIELGVIVAGDADRHPRHVIGKEKGRPVPGRADCAIAGCFELSFRGVDIETPAVLGADSGVVDELLLERIDRPEDKLWRRTAALIAGREGTGRKNQHDGRL